MNEIFLDLMELLKGLLLISATTMAYVWSELYPTITIMTVLVAGFVALHSFARLVYRWWKGENTITSKDNPI